MKKFLLTIFVLSICLISNLQGQFGKNIVTGTINGKLIDCYGNVVKNAKVTIKNQEISRNQKSNKKGLFKFQLPKGTYEITVEKCGFKKVIIHKVDVQESEEKNITVDMQVSYATHGTDNCNPYNKPCP